MLSLRQRFGDFLFLLGARRFRFRSSSLDAFEFRGERRSAFFLLGERGFELVFRLFRGDPFGDRLFQFFLRSGGVFLRCFARRQTLGNKLLVSVRQPSFQLLLFPLRSLRGGSGGRLGRFQFRRGDLFCSFSRRVRFFFDRRELRP